jgi:dTDP-4-amino-4,6-dideoxygalactose transaminase
MKCVEVERMIPVTKSCLPAIDEYLEYLKKIWSTCWLTNDGELVQLLGKRLEDRLRVKNLVLMSNGTLAIHLALKGLALKGEVITTPFTFAATTNVLLWEGLTPVFADIDSETYNIDPADVERRITNKTSAILAVHVYGNPCYVHALREIAEKNDLRLVYDAAHAFDVEYDNQPITNFGDVSTLSFHATKVFNTIEGGAAVARDEGIVERLKLMRNHGIKSESEVILPGTNAKMNEFQAAMGLCNLEHLSEKIRRRKEIYGYYVQMLSGAKGLSFQKVIASKYNYSYMPVCFENNRRRDDAYSELIMNGIKPRKYFFPLTTDFNYFKNDASDLAKTRKLKVASDISDRVLCLPLYPDLEFESIDKIVKIVRVSCENG